MSKLEIGSGSQIERYKWIHEDDVSEVSKLILSGELSGFLAAPGEPNLGGPLVQQLEKQWASFSNKSYAVAFNSWTSGLEAMVAAFQFPKGSEILVTSWTMSATVAAIINNDLIPRFVDIDRSTYNLDPSLVSNSINSKTVAILAADIFGKCCPFRELRSIADKHNLYLLVDSAQAPDASLNGAKSSEYAHASGFSFNRHKHLQCGEGGIAVTSDPQILENMRLYRNHSEVSSTSISNGIKGHNLRFGEIEANLIICQMRRIEKMMNDRRETGIQLAKGLSTIDDFQVELLEKDEVHDYYILGINLSERLSRKRKEFAEQLRLAGIPGILEGYVNAHKLPQFSKFSDGPLPNSEYLNEFSFLGIYICGFNWNQSLIDYTLEKFDLLAK
jgi:perosamine synthetase